MPTYSVANSYQDLRDFERSMSALGGELNSVRIPVVAENGQILTNSTPNAESGNNDKLLDIEKYFQDFGAPQNIQVQVSRAYTDRAISDWGSFDDATKFLQTAPVTE